MHGVFQPLASMTNPLGLCCFYCTWTLTCLSPMTPKPLATVEHVKKLLFLASTQRHGRISSWFSKVGLLLLWVCCRNCICEAHLFVSLFTCLEKPRMGTSHACHVVHSACTPSKMIWPTLTILSAHAL